jgi:nitrilase
MPKVAIAQIAPVFLDRAACLKLAIEAIAQAASDGASLIVFPEAFITGYPAWIWRLRPGLDHAACASLHKKLVLQASTVSGNDLAELYQAAKTHSITVVCGIQELDAHASQTTLFNTVLLIDQQGVVQNKHRKLVPTNAERMIWGQGDGSGLKVVPTSAGNIGALICWENYMPLARYTLYAQGLQVYIAPTYDSGDMWISSMRHIARESGSWVISANNAFRAADLGSDILAITAAYPDPDEWVNPGDSVVVAPGGEIVAGPWRCQQGIFYADIDLSAVIDARRSLDVAGHYARPDLFKLDLSPNPNEIVTKHNQHRSSDN